MQSTNNIIPPFFAFVKRFFLKKLKNIDKYYLVC